MVACRIAGAGISEVPGGMAVWALPGDKPQDLCQESQRKCQAACTNTPPKAVSGVNTSFLDACFSFMSEPDSVSFMCMCVDGSYPKALEGLQPISSLDVKTGKMVGDAGQASVATRSLYPVSFGFFVLLYCLNSLMY